MMKKEMTMETTTSKETAMDNGIYCSERVGYSSRNFRGNRCQHKPAVQREVIDVQYVQKTEAAPEGWDGVVIKGKSERVDVPVLKWFCTTHDPERKAAKEAKKAAAWKAEQLKQQQARAAIDVQAINAKAAATRLGMGWAPAYGEWAGNVILTANQARDLANRLEAAEAQITKETR